MFMIYADAFRLATLAPTASVRERRRWACWTRRRLGRPAVRDAAS